MLSCDPILFTSPTQKRERIASVPVQRASAMAWLDVWSLSDAVGWAKAALVRPGFLSPWRGEAVPFFFEDGAGFVWAGTRHGELDDDEMPDVVARLWDRPEPVLGAADFGVLIRAARQRVLDELRALIANPPNDGFVLAALDAGRVVQSAVGGQDGSAKGPWVVRVTAMHSLSEQVLALFAADLLENRADYYEALTVCGLCEHVAFDAGGLDVPRLRCVDHQDEP